MRPAGVLDCSRESPRPLCFTSRLSWHSRESGAQGGATSFGGFGSAGSNRLPSPALFSLSQHRGLVPHFFAGVVRRSGLLLGLASSNLARPTAASTSRRPKAVVLDRLVLTPAASNPGVGIDTPLYDPSPCSCCGFADRSTLGQSTYVDRVRAVRREGLLRLQSGFRARRNFGSNSKRAFRAQARVSSPAWFSLSPHSAAAASADASSIDTDPSPGRCAEWGYFVIRRSPVRSRPSARA